MRLLLVGYKKRECIFVSPTPRTIRIKGRVKTVSLVNLLDFRFWKYS